MIVVHAHIEIKEGMAEELLKAVDKCVIATRKEIGNNFYTVSTDSFNPLKFIVVEEWESKPDLDAHMQTPHFANLGEEIKDLLAAPLDIKVYEAAAV